MAGPVVDGYEKGVGSGERKVRVMSGGVRLCTWCHLAVPYEYQGVWWSQH